MIRGTFASHRNWPIEAYLALLAAIGGLASILYISLTSWQSGDAIYWFVPWLDHIISYGPGRALAEPMRVKVEGADGFANYNLPYLYLLIIGSLAKGLFSPLAIVKLVSIAGTLICAACMYRLLRVFARPRPALMASAGLLLLPTVALNGPAWGQTDAIWAGLVVLAVASALREEWALMMMAFGGALAFKLQAIFIAPFILYVVISRRVPIRMIFLPVVIYVIALVPAWLAGRPAWQMATAYLDQANTYRWLSMNAPNPWAFVQHLHLLSYDMGVAVGLSMATLAALGLSALSIRWKLQGTDLLLLAVLVAALMPYLLPKMHDRYFFLADILAYALAISKPRRWTIGVAVAIQLGSLGAYGAHLFEISIGKYIGAAFIGLALVVMGIQLLRALNASGPSLRGEPLDLAWFRGWRVGGRPDQAFPGRGRAGVEGQSSGVS